jgi:predicted NBD/HSP70 family sugar kinase
MTALLAIDLGGTRLRAARAGGGAVRPEVPPARVLDVAAPAGLDGLRDTLGRLVAAERPEALGIAVPGLVEGSLCRWMPNLPWLDGVDLQAMFPGPRVRVANDAHFALLAEAVAGAAQGVETAILLAMGTGIGSALLAGGRISRGAAASFGWACADLEDPGHAEHGWLERQASGQALDAEAREMGLADGRALVAAARAGEPHAVASVERAARALGTALAGAVALTGCGRIVVSGGLSDALDMLGPPLLDRLRAHLPPQLRAVELVQGRFGSAASLAGAALAAGGHPAWEGAE